ncbi:MAG: YicC/YloC family endoribonuclease [Myxococcaceae bacterium]
MTGFGAARARAGEETLSVEVRAVNHKHCEVKVRLPKELSSLDAAITRVVKERIHRGAVDVAVRREGAAAAGLLPTVDVPLAQAYAQALRQVAAQLGLSDTVSLRDVATQPGVLRLEERTVDANASWSALEGAVTQALDALRNMRATEGAVLREELALRLSRVEAHLAEVVRGVPHAVTEAQQRMSERVRELAAAAAVDPQRLAQEVAILAERTDVSEEIARLGSHLAQFRSLLDANEPVGRRMDFLVQEMHREVNTTGAKTQHAALSQHIITMKLELERLREQVQNIE